MWDEEELVLTALSDSEYHSQGLYRYDTNLWLVIDGSTVRVTTWSDRMDEDAGHNVESSRARIEKAISNVPMPTIMDKLYYAVKERMQDGNG